MTPSYILSKRELEVLKLVALGNSNKEIAHILQISEYTIEKHLTHIFQKIQVTNRIAASYWYWKSRT